MNSPPSPAAESYVPDLVRSWHADDPPHRRVGGSLVSADISGFTALSERLAEYRREGAEELTSLLNRCFGGMIEIIDAHGGDVLKFGGDALLVLFEGVEHTARAAAACVEMRALIERPWSTQLIKRIDLGISQGIHSGDFDLHLVEAGHRELFVVGPGMSATVDCEGAAERGQILLSHAAAAGLDPDLLGERTDDGVPLARAPELSTPSSQRRRGDGPVDSFVPDWLVEQIAAGTVAEHRMVTVGFVFFGGVDALLESDGPDAAHERLQALATATDEAASRHGVHWLASDVYAGGGKIILTAGAPRSTGQDEDAAVRTARALIDTDVGLPVRIGLNRGPVYMGDLGSPRRRTFTVMGDAVNLAARLMQKSAPGQVVASAAVLDNVPTDFATEELEPFLVKGKTEPIRASLVGDRIDMDDGETGAPIAQAELEFIGRSHELAVLENAIRTARSGHGIAVDVVGEPGIGKSRLVAEALRREVDDAATTLRAKGGLYSRGTPYLAVTNMLRDLIGVERNVSSTVAGRVLTSWVLDRAPDLAPWLPLLGIAFGADTPSTPEADLIDPANRAAKLREVVVDLLTATVHGPVIFVVDDAHRLDEASDELFAAVLRRLANRPWLLISLRWRDHPTFIDESSDAVAVDVGTLDPEDAAALARAAAAGDPRYDDEDRLEDLIGRGVTNPLFLLELVRSGIDRNAATPDTIETLITARIDTLSARDRLLLREAAVLGSVVEPRLLAQALDDHGLRNPERWSGLSGFLFAGADGAFHFQQGLYREISYEGLSYRRRREIHAAVGRELERRAGEDWESSSELLSLHFHAARDWERSWRYSVIAGDRARSMYAHVEAADFYSRALEVPATHRPAANAIASVAEILGDELELTAQFDRANDALALARRKCSNTADRIRIMRKSGVIQERQGKYPQALRWYGRGLTATEGLDREDAAVARGDLSLAYAGVRFRQGRLSDAIQWAQRAEKIGRELDDPKILAHSAYLLTAGYAMLRSPEIDKYRDVSLPLFEKLGDLVGQGNVLNNLGVSARDDSRWREALEYYDQSRVVWDQVGDVIGAATTALNIAEILAYQGHLVDAERLLEDAIRSCRRSGYEVGLALARMNLGRLRAQSGQYDEARRLQEDARERLERLGAVYHVLETRVMQVECEALARQGGRALELAGPLLQEVRGFDDPILGTILLRIMAWAHMMEGDLQQSEYIAEECITLGEVEGAVFEVALALVLLGQIYESTGRDRRPHHDRARKLLTQLGVVQLPRLAELAPSTALNTNSTRPGTHFRSVTAHLEPHS